MGSLGLGLGVLFRACRFGLRLQNHEILTQRVCFGVTSLSRSFTDATFSLGWFDVLSVRVRVHASAGRFSRVHSAIASGIVWLHEVQGVQAQWLSGQESVIGPDRESSPLRQLEPQREGFSGPDRANKKSNIFYRTFYMPYWKPTYDFFRSVPVKP